MNYTYHWIIPLIIIYHLDLSSERNALTCLLMTEYNHVMIHSRNDTYVSSIKILTRLTERNRPFFKTFFLPVRSHLRRTDGSDNKLVIEGSWTFFESSASVARDAITIPLPAPATLMDIYYRHRRWLLKRQLTPKEIEEISCKCCNKKLWSS